jgi:hypothetical protein
VTGEGPAPAGVAGPGSLRAALEAVESATRLLPESEAAFALSPAERRRLHDLGVRIQDRLLDALSQLVADMARDGADLLDGVGLPRSYSGPPGPEDGATGRRAAISRERAPADTQAPPDKRAPPAEPLAGSDYGASSDQST